MKVKKDYIIKRVGSGYVVVTVGEASHEFNGMIRLNEAGAFLLKNLERGISREDLLQEMLSRYDDLSRENAEMDLDEFLEKVAFALDEM